MTEAWLRGPVAGVPPVLMPAAHALQQAALDARTAPAGLSADAIWIRPGGAAAIGFHLRHIAGVVDRLLTYARGESLSEEQLAALKQEREPGTPPAAPEALLAAVDRAVERAIDTLRETGEEDVYTAREVGRARLPSNVLGLLFHAAEHAQRHAGQIITTARVLRGLGMVAEGDGRHR